MTHSQVVIRLLNNGESPLAVAVTLSKGLPTTREMYRSSSPPNPTRSSASTSKGWSVGFQSSTMVRCGAGPGAELSTVDEVQKGMKAL